MLEMCRGRSYCKHTNNELQKVLNAQTQDVRLVWRVTEDGGTPASAVNEWRIKCSLCPHNTSVFLDQQCQREREETQQHLETQKRETLITLFPKQMARDVCRENPSGAEEHLSHFNQTTHYNSSVSWNKYSSGSGCWLVSNCDVLLTRLLKNREFNVSVAAFNDCTLTKNHVYP